LLKLDFALLGTKLGITAESAATDCRLVRLSIDQTLEFLDK
jgi:hypothetical protein